MRLSIILALFAPSIVLASPPLQNPLFKPAKPKTSLPVVLWHGLGDTYDGKGLASIAALINETYPGTFVHSVYLDEDSSKDRNAGFIGHVAEQVAPAEGRADDRLNLFVSNCREYQSCNPDLMRWDSVKGDNFSGMGNLKMGLSTGALWSGVICPQ